MSTCPDCETGRNLLAGACRSVFQRGLTGGSAGNMSLRVEGGILATPTGIPFGELTPGAQVRVRRSGYYHHGIYIGNGEIVHFDGSPNEQDAAAVRVRRTGMEEFLRGGLPELRIYGRAERKLLRASDEIVAAALSAVGRSGYDYRTNNCEHFSNECAFGEHYSRQSGEGNK